MITLRRSFKKCPRCDAKLRTSVAYLGNPSEFWLECPDCNTYVNTYIPQEHQRSVHLDQHRYIGNFGAYGTGKTTTSRQEIYKHIFLTPEANILVGANITPQYEQTIKRELESDVPHTFVSSYSAQKSFMDFINNARIMYRPLDDEGKLRSLNLSMFVIVEASETKGEAFHQLKTRLRNTAATTQQLDNNLDPVFTQSRTGQPIPVIDADWRKGIIESNPDAGWIRTDVLLPSEKITQHGSVSDVYQQEADEIDSSTSSHVASTDVNEFLPDDFIEELSANKPIWWINRYIHSSFTYAEGLVYPRALEQIVPAFPVPPGWKRIVAFDYGLTDEAVFVLGAIDPRSGILYIYAADASLDKNIEALANKYKELTADIPSGLMISQPLIDPKSGAKRDYNKKTLITHFQDYGIYFKPGHVSVDARIFRLNTYIEQGRVKIMDDCTFLIKELRDYKFPALSLNTQVKKQKPVDKNNHAINAMEWITMELPANPKMLEHGAFDSYGDSLLLSKVMQRTESWQLAEEEDYSAYDGGSGAFGIGGF